MSKEAKALLLASLIQGFVCAPVVAIYNNAPESHVTAVAGFVSLLLIAFGCLIAGLIRLEKEGLFYVPTEPKISPFRLFLYISGGAMISVIITMSNGIFLEYTLVSLWFAMFCISSALAYGLYAAGFRFTRGRKS